MDKQQQLLMASNKYLTGVLTALADEFLNKAGIPDMENLNAPYAYRDCVKSIITAIDTINKG